MKQFLDEWSDTILETAAIISIVNLMLQILGVEPLRGVVCEDDSQEETLGFWTRVSSFGSLVLAGVGAIVGIAWFVWPDKDDELV